MDGHICHLIILWCYFLSYLGMWFDDNHTIGNIRGVIMIEILLVSIFALLTISLVVDTQRKIKKHEKANNTVFNNIYLKSDNFTFDKAINQLRNSNSKIIYNCQKQIESF